MAVKTITIDMDAYRTLSRLKKPGQSFSQVIKEKLGHHKTAGTLIQAIERIHLSNDTLDAVEKVVRRRKKSVLKHPRL
jgi:predicted CopG family antitoxin